MSKIRLSFKYLDNSLSAFQTVEKHFPFGNHLKKFNDRYKKYPERTLLQAELERIKIACLDSTGPINDGYSHRLQGRDHALSSVYIDFVAWATNEALSWKRVFEVEDEISKGCRRRNYDKLLELKYIELFSLGINDARLQNHIQSLLDEIIIIPTVIASKKVGPSHREQVLINQFKFGAGLEDLKQAKEHRAEGKQKRYEAYLSLQRSSKSKSNPYIAPKPLELKNVIAALQNVPLARERAEEYLESLNHTP